MNKPTNRKEYRDTLRSFLKETRKEVYALQEEFQHAMRTQALQPRAVKNIRERLQQSIDQLSDAVYWHQVCRAGGEARKISDSMENWLHIVATCLCSFHDEAKKEFARLSNTRFEIANAKIIAILNKHRKRSHSLWWRLFSSTAKIRQKMGKELRPIFVEIESACQRDFEAWITSTYESKSKELQQLVDFIRRDAGERIGDEAELQLAAIWEKTQISTSLSQVPKLPSLLVPLIDDSNSLLMQIISPERKAKEETDTKTAWKSLLGNLSCSQDKAFDGFWSSSAMGTWDRNCKQTENWVRLCKSASVACAKAQVPQEELEEKLHRIKEMKEYGKNLAVILHSNPEWCRDEQDLETYQKVYQATASALAGSALDFGTAAWKAIKLRIDMPGNTNPEQLRKEVSSLKAFMELLAKDTLGNAAKEKEKQSVRLDWRGLGAAVFELPEYFRYRKAVADAVQTLQAKANNLEFYSHGPTDWEKEIHSTAEATKKAWDNYWKNLAPEGVFTAPFHKVLNTVVEAFGVAVYDIWENEKKRLAWDFHTDPAKQYNFYYNP